MFFLLFAICSLASAMETGSSSHAPAISVRPPEIGRCRGLDTVRCCKEEIWILMSDEYRRANSLETFTSLVAIVKDEPLRFEFYCGDGTIKPKPDRHDVVGPFSMTCPPTKPKLLLSILSKEGRCVAKLPFGAKRFRPDAISLQAASDGIISGTSRIINLEHIADDQPSTRNVGIGVIAREPDEVARMRCLCVGGSCVQDNTSDSSAFIEGCEECAGCCVDFGLCFGDCCLEVVKGCCCPCRDGDCRLNGSEFALGPGCMFNKHQARETETHQLDVDREFGGTHRQVLEFWISSSE